MEDGLSQQELAALLSLSTIEPVKPELPEVVAARLIHLGYAIALVEGGLQLTSLGRERLTEEETH
jgi:hypothetical protein